MNIYWGVSSFDYVKQQKIVPIVWNSKNVINHHILMMGASGTGKTYNLRNMISQIQKQDSKVRIHILDFHGDIQIDGASSVKFSESTNYGINPLIINPNPDFGGVRKRIQSFITALDRTSRLGSKQQAVLRNLLTDLYIANGFYPDKPSSWVLDDGVVRKHPKKYPTLLDALKFANFKLQTLFFGANTKTMFTLEKVNKNASKLYFKQKAAKKYKEDDESLEKMKVELETIKDQAKLDFSEYIDNINTGTELTESMKYDSKDVMKSVVEKLENLNSMGIFKDNKPNFDDSNNVWRYEINSLLLEEKKLFVNFILEDIFQKRFQEGVKDDIQEMIIVDEANVFFNDESDSILNIIAKEARKFGLGLICASQSPTHFSEDFMTNVSCKIILGIDETYWNATYKKLNLPDRTLEFIIPQKSMLIQIKNKGQLKSQFIPCLFINKEIKEAMNKARVNS